MYIEDVFGKRHSVIMLLSHYFMFQCLFWVELPFAEDVRTFTFGSLPLTEEVAVNKKYKPTGEAYAVLFI